MKDKSIDCFYVYNSIYIDNSLENFPIKPCCRAVTVGKTNFIENIKNHDSIKND